MEKEDMYILKPVKYCGGGCKNKINILDHVTFLIFANACEVSSNNTSLWFLLTRVIYTANQKPVNSEFTCLPVF